MADHAAIRAALATRLDLLPNVQANRSPIDAINPPTAIVGEVTVDYDLSFGRGVDSLEIRVRLYVSRADAEDGVVTLDGYMSGSGPSSVKATVEGDRTLAGTVDDCRVKRAENFGVYDVAGTAYLGVEFIITATAKGATP